MTSSEVGDIQSELSYRNMTCKKETVLVLMDSDMHLLKQGVKAVNAAQPVTELASSTSRKPVAWLAIVKYPSRNITI